MVPLISPAAETHLDGNLDCLRKQRNSKRLYEIQILGKGWSEGPMRLRDFVSYASMIGAKLTVLPLARIGKRSSKAVLAGSKYNGNQPIGRWLL